MQAQQAARKSRLAALNETLAEAGDVLQVLFLPLHPTPRHTPSPSTPSPSNNVSIKRVFILVQEYESKMEEASKYIQLLQEGAMPAALLLADHRAWKAKHGGGDD